MLGRPTVLSDPDLPIMTPLESWPPAERARIRGVLTDIDDTLTTDGALSIEARDALQRLQDAGLPVFAITGRGRLERTLRPGLAGAGHRRGKRCRRPVARCEWTTGQGLAAERSHPRRPLPAAAGRGAGGAAPGTTGPAGTDSPGRETDIAIDHSEFHHLSAAEIEAVVAIVTAGGLRATVSSIHINGWIGDHDKLVGARWILRERMGIDLDAELDRWVYVGDSTNDARMFGHCVHTVGVANIRRFWDQLSHRPRYVTHRERGAGFAELAQALLESR